MRRPGAVCWTAFCASWTIACVIRCGSSRTSRSATPSSTHARSPRVRTFTNTSAVSSASCTGSGRTKSGRSAPASSSRSSTMRLIRSSSSVTSRTVSSRSAGSSPISSRWPRTMVIGVRSSCPASSTKTRCAANARSSRSSIALNVSARAAMSSRPSTGIRRVRSCSVNSAAVARTIRTGARMRPATAQPIPVVISSATPDRASSVQNVLSATARSRSGWKATTNAPGFPPAAGPIATFAQRTSPCGRFSVPKESSEAWMRVSEAPSRHRAVSAGRSRRWRMASGRSPGRPVRPSSSSSGSAYWRCR